MPNIIHDTLPRAIELIEGGSLALAPLITHVLPLERVNEGISLMRSGGRLGNRFDHGLES